MPTLKEINEQIKNHRTVVYFEQDGADFHLYADIQQAECADTLETVTAPFRVKDSDMCAADNAREWFITVFCRDKRLTPVNVFNKE